MTLSEFGDMAEKAAVIFMRLGVSLIGDDSVESDTVKAETEMCRMRGKLLGLLANLSYGEAISFEELDDTTERYWILQKYLDKRTVAHI